MKQKILLVGESHICSQVAYVMDWPDYATAKCLAEVAKYQDCQIVVCALKRKSKTLVKVATKGLNLKYLDDLGRELDATYARNNYATDPVKVLPKKVLLKTLRWWYHGMIRRQFWLHKVPASYLRQSELL